MTSINRFCACSSSAGGKSLKMVNGWTVIEIDNLISLVKEHPCLYIQSYRENFDKDAVERIWASIARKLGKSNRNVKRKWVGLMMKYENNEAYPTVTKDWTWIQSKNFLKIFADSQNGVKESDISSESVERFIVCKKKDAVGPTMTVTSVTYNGEKSLPNNTIANKLFFDSIVDDLTSLSLKDQYDFKMKVLSLMEKYLNK